MPTAAQHDGHGAGKILAMPNPMLGEEVFDRIELRVAADFCQRVAEVSRIAQIIRQDAGPLQMIVGRDRPHDLFSSALWHQPAGQCRLTSSAA